MIPTIASETSGMNTLYDIFDTFRYYLRRSYLPEQQSLYNCVCDVCALREQNLRYIDLTSGFMSIIDEGKKRMMEFFFQNKRNLKKNDRDFYIFLKRWLYRGGELVCIQEVPVESLEQSEYVETINGILTPQLTSQPTKKQEKQKRKEEDKFYQSVWEDYLNELVCKGPSAELQEEKRQKITDETSNILIEEYHIDALALIYPISNEYMPYVLYNKYNYDKIASDICDQPVFTPMAVSTEETDIHALIYTIYDPKEYTENKNSFDCHILADKILNYIIHHIIKVSVEQKGDYPNYIKDAEKKSEKIIDSLNYLKTTLYSRTDHQSPTYLIVAPDVYELLIEKFYNMEDTNLKTFSVKEVIHNNSIYAGKFMNMHLYVSSFLKKGEFVMGIGSSNASNLKIPSIMWTPYYVVETSFLGGQAMYEPLHKAEEEGCKEITADNEEFWQEVFKTSEYNSIFDIKDLNPQLILRSKIIYDDEIKEIPKAMEK